MDSTYRNPNDRPELRLRELLDAIRRRKLLIGIFVLLCTIAGGLLGWLLPKSYKAVIVVSRSSTPRAPLRQVD
jgi:uncharacterized protein involved in exopolysaccharide biosynthesis